MTAQELYGNIMNDRMKAIFDCLWNDGMTSTKFGEMRRQVKALGITPAPAPIFTYNVWEDRTKLVQWCDIMLLGTKQDVTVVHNMIIE